MTDFVLDNSVVMRWASQGLPRDQAYAEKVLASLESREALVPNLLHLEVANVLLALPGIDTASQQSFIAQLNNLPIYVDSLTYHNALGPIHTIAKEYNLTSYDAAYLELAIRVGVPLATLDKALIKAAKKAKVDIYCKEVKL